MDWETVASYLWTVGGPVIVILAVALWVFRPGSKKRYQRDAQIPFQDEEKARASARKSKKETDAKDEQADKPS